MIPQFKKLFLSLIFTVVLFCGLTVSAFATSTVYTDNNGFSLYNGRRYPSLPAVDTSVYSYYVIYDIGSIDNVRLVFCDKPITYYYRGSLYWFGCASSDYTLIWYSFVNGEWRYDLTIENNDPYALSVAVQDLQFLWTAQDIKQGSTVKYSGSAFSPLDDYTLVLWDGVASSTPIEQYYYYVGDFLLNRNSLPVIYHLSNSTGNITTNTFGQSSSYYSFGSYPYAGLSVFDSSLASTGLYLYKDSDYVSAFAFKQAVYSPVIFATTSNVTASSVLLTIDVTGMDPSKTYNVRLDGITADGEEQSTIVGTITGRESYSISDTLGPFDSDTTYRATLVLLEDGVEVSSDLIEFTTLPESYDPSLTVSPFSITSNTITCQIDMTDFDPSGRYRLYYELKFADDVGDQDTYISKGFSNQIGIISGISDYTGYHRFTDLTPNTEYYTAWTVEDMDTGNAVLVVDSFYFTTLDDGSGGGGSGSSDDDSGILLMILNKVSAILDTMNGGQSEGILASINEKLNALIDTLANPEEQQLEDNFKGSLTEVNNNFFGDSAVGQAVTVSDVGNLADTQGTVKNIFQSEYTVSDFFGIFSDQSLFAWFTADTAMDLNPNAYGGAALADLDDPYNMQDYYDNLEKVRGKK